MRLCIGSYRNISSVFIEPTHTHRHTQTHSHTHICAWFEGICAYFLQKCVQWRTHLSTSFGTYYFSTKVHVVCVLFHVLCNFSHLQLELLRLLHLTLLFFWCFSFFCKLLFQIAHKSKQQGNWKLGTAFRPPFFLRLPLAFCCFQGVSLAIFFKLSVLAAFVQCWATL